MDTNTSQMMMGEIILGMVVMMVFVVKNKKRMTNNDKNSKVDYHFTLSVKCQHNVFAWNEEKTIDSD